MESIKQRELTKKIRTKIKLGIGKFGKIKEAPKKIKLGLKRRLRVSVSGTTLVIFASIFALSILLILGETLTIYDVIKLISSGEIEKIFHGTIIISCFIQVIFGLAYLMRKLITQLVSLGAIVCGIIVLAYALTLFLESQVISFLFLILGSLELIFGLKLRKKE